MDERFDAGASCGLPQRRGGEGVRAHERGLVAAAQARGNVDHDIHALAGRIESRVVAGEVGGQVDDDMLVRQVVETREVTRGAGEQAQLVAIGVQRSGGVTADEAAGAGE